MKRSVIDYFNTFKACSREYDLSASARSIYYALLEEFNAAYFPEELKISDRQMLELSGVKSLSTIHDVRNLLKSLKLIDFRRGKNNKSIYKLLDAKINQTQSSALSEREPNTCRKASERNGVLTIPSKSLQEDIRHKDIRHNIIQSAHARDSINLEDNITPEDIDSLLEYWEKSGGCKLNQVLIAKLTVLARDAGLSELKVAIDKANEGANNPKYGFSLEYVKSKLVKEVNTNDGDPNQRGYERPETDKDLEGILSTIEL